MTTALKNENYHCPKRWVAQQKLSPNLGTSEEHGDVRIGGFPATLSSKTGWDVVMQPGPRAEVHETGGALSDSARLTGSVVGDLQVGVFGKALGALSDSARLTRSVVGDLQVGVFGKALGASQVKSSQVK